MVPAVTFNNLQNTFTQLAPQVDEAIQQEIVNDGHYKTGALFKSVKTVSVQTDDGFALQTSMFDYWVFLNARTGFRDIAVSSLQNAIKVSIAQAVNNDLNIYFSQIFNQ